MEKKQDEKSSHPDDYVAESKKRSSAEKYVKYPLRIIRMCNNPHNLRRLRDANVFARFTGPCGDSMGFYLRIVNEIVEEATFTTSGCCGSVASGCMLTRLVKGKSVKHSRYVTERDLLDALGGMPERNDIVRDSQSRLYVWPSASMRMVQPPARKTNKALWRIQERDESELTVIEYERWP